MVRGAKIRVRVDQRALTQLQKLPEKVRELGMVGLERGTSRVAENLRSQIIMRNLIWSEALLHSVEHYKIEGEEGYEIKMLAYGEELNQAPSTAKREDLRRGRKLTTWARAKLQPPFPPTLYVMGPEQAQRYGGWKDAGLENAEEIVVKHMENELSKLG